MKTETHTVKIGNSQFWIQGGNTELLKEIAQTIGLKYDSIEPSKLPASQGIIKVWAIGELSDYLLTKGIEK